MSENEQSDYLVNKLIFEVEQNRFEHWYKVQYEKTSLRKVRQVAFQKQMEKWLRNLNRLYVPVQVYEILEKIEKMSLEDED